jgi:hypothetical protein
MTEGSAENVPQERKRLVRISPSQTSPTIEGRATTTRETLATLS